MKWPWARFTGRLRRSFRKRDKWTKVDEWKFCEGDRWKGTHTYCTVSGWSPAEAIYGECWRLNQIQIRVKLVAGKVTVTLHERVLKAGTMTDISRAARVRGCLP